MLNLRSRDIEGAPVTADEPSVDGVDTVAARLRGVLWDFADATTRDGIHDLHPYPARFIPEIPRELIKIFPPDAGTAVLDPFCGCGTALVEAAVAGIPAIGVDLNPLAALISRVKTTPPTQSIGPLAQEIVRGLESRRADIPDIPRLDHWFKPGIQEALASITAGISRVDDEVAKDALRVALSRIVVRVSNQDSDTRYAAVNKSVTKADVVTLFMRSAEAVERTLVETYGGLFPLRPEVQVIHANALLLRPSDLRREVGLVVTSPPYPNAYEYWLYHKYRMYWLGMDPIALRRDEIGARPHYFRKNHQTEVEFEAQMTTVFALLAEVLAPGRYACFVVGRSIIHGHRINNVEILERAASQSGFRLVACVGRTIARNRKSFNLSHAAINEEHVAVFQRGGASA